MAIVALWAAVLIPMWLRRHDDDQARRIERHRVAMGTLARIADDPDAEQGAAARRRRVVVAATATVGALVTAAWVAGVVPGLVALVGWLPLVVFLPAALVSERRASRVAADRALQERRERRESRVARRASHSDAAGSDQATHRPDAAPSVRSSWQTGGARPAVTSWDDVFDQTA